MSDFYDIDFYYADYDSSDSSNESTEETYCQWLDDFGWI